MHNALPCCYTDVTHRLPMQHPPAKQLIPWEAPLAPYFEESAKGAITTNNLKARVLYYTGSSLLTKRSDGKKVISLLISNIEQEQWAGTPCRRKDAFATTDWPV